METTGVEEELPCGGNQQRQLSSVKAVDPDSPATHKCVETVIQDE